MKQMFKILNQIRVNAVCSGAILMLGIKGLIADSTDPDAKMREFTSRRLTGYVGSVEGIAATNINGAIISVDGGSTC
jgi:NAD(P)-dependent dehydrogenase (short-subunit alcohol dehydrogenase family)